MTTIQPGEFWIADETGMGFISNPVASELYGRGGFIGFVNTYQISWLTRPYKNYDDTIPNPTEMILYVKPEF
jgi:hypothetical protein